MRRVNQAGIDLIKSFEGLRTRSYRDPVGILTIGYGSTGPHVMPGMSITEEQAEALLRQDVARFEAGVQAYLRDAPATDNEFAALVSLAFNIGLGAFRRSTVLRQHRAGRKKLAAAAFLLWVRAGKRTLKGLVRRRDAERRLYLS